MQSAAVPSFTGALFDFLMKSGDRGKSYYIESGAGPESSRDGDGAGKRGIIGPSAESAVPSILLT